MKIQKIRSAGIIVNYKCSAACKHCAYASSPSWPNDYITVKTIQKIGKKLRSHGCYSCHIGGGEPFWHPEKLVAACQALLAEGVAIEYVETNGSWYGSEEKATGIIQQLLDIGVNCLLISIDPFHNEFIPAGKPLALAALCERLGMDTFIWQTKYLKYVNAFDCKKPHSLEEYTERFGKNFVRQSVYSYGLMPNGRAVLLLKQLLPGKAAADIMADTEECHGLQDSSHCHLDLYENYIPPACTGLTIAIDDLEQEIDPQKYPVVSALYAHGPKAIYEKAVDLGFRESAKGYVHKCDLCMDLKRFLAGCAPSLDLGYAQYFEELRGLYQ